MARTPIEYELDPSVDVVFDEATGNTFLALRKIAWGGKDNFRLDMRKWFTSSDGSEVPGKGVSFMTEEGPHCLVKTLLDLGYGHTDEVIDSIKDREDFMEYITPIVFNDESTPKEKNKSKKSKEIFYDPKEVLG